jgi:TATA-box binding
MGKKHILMLLCVTLIIFLYGFQAMREGESNQDKISQIVEIYDQNGIEVEEWAMYTRETLDLASLKDAIAYIEGKLGSLEWEKNVDKAVTIIQNHAYTERIVVVNHGQKVQLMYEVKGDKWNKKEWETLSKKIEEQIDDIFPLYPIIFSCVKGVFDDKIEGVLQKQAQRLLSDFQAESIESLNEGTFVSISAYNSKWNDALPTEKKKMNLQLGIRQDEKSEKTTITVGTPIITSEY